MLISQALNTCAFKITGYTQNSIIVNGNPLVRPFVITENKLEDWAVTDIAAICLDDFAIAIEQGNPLIILGTGKRQIMPTPEVIGVLGQKGIVIETMDSFSACRTYEILSSEKRQVTGMFWIDE